MADLGNLEKEVESTYGESKYYRLSGRNENVAGTTNVDKTRTAQLELQAVLKDYDALVKKIEKNVGKYKSAAAYLKAMFTSGRRIENARGFLQKLPLINKMFGNRPISAVFKDIIDAVQENHQILGSYLEHTIELERSTYDEVVRLNLEAVNVSQLYDKAGLELEKVTKQKELETKKYELIENKKSTEAIKLKSKLDELESGEMIVKNNIYQHQRDRDRILNLSEGLRITRKGLLLINTDMNQLYNNLDGILEQQKVTVGAQLELTRANDLLVNVVNTYESFREGANELIVLITDSVKTIAKNAEDIVHNKLYDEQKLQKAADNLVKAEEFQKKRNISYNKGELESKV